MPNLLRYDQLTPHVSQQRGHQPLVANYGVPATT